MTNLEIILIVALFGAIFLGTRGKEIIFEGVVKFDSVSADIVRTARIMRREDTAELHDLCAVELSSCTGLIGLPSAHSHREAKELEGKRVRVTVEVIEEE